MGCGDSLPGTLHAKSGIWTSRPKPPLAVLFSGEI